MISAGFRVNEESDEGYSSTAGFYEANKKKPHASMKFDEISQPGADKQESSYQAPTLAEGVEEEKKEVVQPENPNTVSFGASNKEEIKERL